jgi:peptidyl-prolyl cis-trans isomerase SurA
MEWLDVSTLPAPLRPIVIGLKPGEVSAPIELEQAVLLFQLRGIEETVAPPAKVAAIEYAQYFIPGGQTAEAQGAAAKLRSRVDTCDDLYGIAKGQPEERLQRDVLPPSDIPPDIGLELAKLDRHEVSTAVTRNGGETLVFLMLCGRTADLSLDENRDAIRNRLRSERLASYADGLLAELRADALIIE